MKVPQKKHTTCFFFATPRDWKNPTRIHLGMVLSILSFFWGGVVFFLFHVNHFVFLKKSSEVRDMKTGGLDLLVCQLMAVDLFVEPPGVVSWVLISMPGITRPSYDDAMFCFLACLPRARGHRKTSREFGPRFSSMDTFFDPHHSEEI